MVGDLVATTGILVIIVGVPLVIAFIHSRRCHWNWKSKWRALATGQDQGENLGGDFHLYGNVFRDEEICSCRSRISIRTEV